jgi:hypothetical protein
MKNIFLLVFIGTIAALAIACEPSEERVSSSGDINLRFSTDTVLFDTLLTARTSITKRLRIFNTSKKAVSISSIRLGGGRRSPYSIIVNGKFGREVRDEILFGGDSLLILIDVEIDPLDVDLPYLVKDSVIVDWNGNTANTKLIAWGQDAHFINAQKICDETWTAARPYVIYNLAVVDTLCTLTMEPGTRVYLDNGAGLFVIGTLKVKGDTANHVIFRNTRFDENYLEAPGQWDGIYFLEGSKANEIDYAEIENGTYGLRVGSPDDDTDFDLRVTHTSIRHMAVAGILAFSSDVFAANTEIFDCGTAVVLNLAGGNYQYEHCTFSNFPSLFNQKDPSFYYSDQLEIEDGKYLIEPLTMNVQNCIIWGSNDEEVASEFSKNGKVTVSLKNNIIRSKPAIEGNTTSIKSNFPGFNDPFNFDYSLDTLSNAKDKGLQLNYETDIRGLNRDSKPDIGAYERIEK